MIYFKKCEKCGRVLPLWEKASLICCDEEMKEIQPNTFEASQEKHIPSYERKKDFINIKVNHVMEEKHHIKWIMLVNEKEIYFKNLANETDASAQFPYKPNSELYAYCNLHSLWMEKVK